MSFEKGQSGNYGGRPKGSRNRRTELMEDIMLNIFEKYSTEDLETKKGEIESRLWNDFRNIDKPEKRLDVFLKMMEFVFPKKRSVEAEVNSGGRSEIVEAFMQSGLLQ
ncbi:MAG: hypothetical protein HUK08_07870 [Bacteroidaceae bacterium]|nr:hypothetical protein [Bacteroidaceae bacterium]